MTDKSRLRDTINMRIDAQIPRAVNVEVVQRDKDGGILPKLDLTKCNVFALLMLRLRNGTYVHRVDGRAKDVRTILWIGNPARLSTV